MVCRDVPLRWFVRAPDSRPHVSRFLQPAKEATMKKITSRLPASAELFGRVSGTTTVVFSNR